MVPRVEHQLKDEVRIAHDNEPIAVAADVVHPSEAVVAVDLPNVDQRQGANGRCVRHEGKVMGSGEIGATIYGRERARPKQQSCSAPARVARVQA